MNLKKRFLVLDSGNRAVVPKTLGYSAPGLQSADSPSFLKEGAARDFAAWLAKRNPGQNFYLFESKGAVVSYTKPVEDAPAMVDTNETE